MIVYTLTRHIEEGWRTDCFRTKREAQKFRAKVQREAREDEDVFFQDMYKDIEIRKWLIKNKDDLVNFVNIIGI